MYADRATLTRYQREYKRRLRSTPEGKAHERAMSAKVRKKNYRTLMLGKARSRAAEKGVAFDITVDDIDWPEVCPIFGTTLLYGGGHGPHPDCASLDRVEAERGYVRGNVAVLSWRANRIKDNASAQELRAVADWIDARVWTS